MTRDVVPELVTETRRISASSSAETRTSMTVVSVPSRRANSARSSSKATSYSSGATPIGCSAADQTAPDTVSLSRIQDPQSSSVGSSRQRVTSTSPQRLLPEPAWVSITA